MSLDDFGHRLFFAGICGAIFPLTASRSTSRLCAACASGPTIWPSCARVTGLCRSLGISATAEGVETEEELALLMQENTAIRRKDFCLVPPCRWPRPMRWLRPARPDWRKQA